KRPSRLRPLVPPCVERPHLLEPAYIHAINLLRRRVPLPSQRPRILRPLLPHSRRSSHRCKQQQKGSWMYQREATNNPHPLSYSPQFATHASSPLDVLEVDV